MSDKVRHVQLRAGEFLADIAGEVYPDELGVYWMVCLLVYNRNEPVKNDPEWIRDKFKRGTDVRVIRRCIDRLLLIGKIREKDGYLVGKRTLKELDRSRNRIETNTENARKRWAQSGENNGVDHAVASGEAEPPKPSNHKPVTSNQESTPSLRSGAGAPARDRLAIAGEMARVWDELAGVPLGKKPVDLTIGKRVTQAHNRWKGELRGDMERWRTACLTVRHTPLLRGEGPAREGGQPWPGANFDWLINPTNLAKVLAGNYDQQQRAAAAAPPNPRRVDISGISARLGAGPEEPTT